jgi:ribose transport system substrate-binding protein
MKTDQRRQRIVQLLLKEKTISTRQLVDLLQVSEVTVRHDLAELEREGRLIRTHGGAALGSRPDTRPFEFALNQSRVTRNDAAELQRIARRAAEIVEDGDSILLLGSAITRLMADELLTLKSLKALTNSIHIAAALQRNPDNTVMLMGGQVRGDVDVLEGPLTASALRSVRLQKAFVSCDGLTHEQGVADDDLNSAQLKAIVPDYAQQVIVLAPSSSVGRMAMMRFAKLNQVHHVITDESAQPEVIDELRALGVPVSVCSERVTAVSVRAREPKRWRIGFANLNEKQEFAVSVRQSIERAAQASGCIDLLIADNAADPDKALANARDMLRHNVDLLIEYQQDERTNYVIMDLFRSARVPVIGVDIPLPGATFFGADNYRAGRIAGDAAVRWITQHWRGVLNKVICLEQPESGQLVSMRIEGQVDSIRSAFGLGKTDFVRCVTRGDVEGSQLEAIHALRHIPWGKKVLIVGINSDSTLGAIRAIESLQRHECAVAVGQSASARVRREMAHGNPVLVGAVDYAPSKYGGHVIQLALDILQGQATPPAVYTEHILLTCDNVAALYPEEAADITSLS